MKTAYLAVVLLLAGTVACTPAQKIIDLPEWIPDINIQEILQSIRELIGQIWEIVGIEISIQEILQRIWEALGLTDIDWENINLEDILEQIITRIQEIIAEIELPGIPEININRPIEGTAVSITNHPSIVQVEIGAGPVWIQLCAGALVTNFHFVSCSRCFSGKLYSASRRRIRAGSSTRYNDGTIGEIDFALNNGEISLVRLVSSLPFTDTIQPTNIIAQDFETPAGSSVTTAGWGKTSQGRILFSDRDLNQIELTVIDRETCAERWSRLPISSVEVNSNHICAGRSETGGRDGDIRDLGTPLIFNNILIGVHCHSKLVGNQNYPLVFGSISPLTTWIVENAN